jgi:hypothetical protein
MTIDWHRSEVVFSPFRWFFPRVDRAGIDTVYFCGPFRLIIVLMKGD